ncbi:hypothetical protein ES705_25952 [subsurface metagenome]
MKINNELIESLLYEEEGVELDLKSQQYCFIKASDEEKSELLKDILAFANAWRRSDAFILIGVQEIKGGRSNVIGISDLLDDAAIQQFVTTKTNRPVIFSYQNLSFEGKNIAVLHIPLQQRPFYLKKDYGNLKKETVYVRRGSSTNVASLDEISRMGIPFQIEFGNPVFEVFFADPKTRARLTDEQKINSLALNTLKISTIPDYTQEHGPLYNIRMTETNRSYYRELVEYTRKTKLVSPIHVAIENSGPSTAGDVRIEMKIDKAGGNVIVIDSYEYPEIPESEYKKFPFSPGIMNKIPVNYDVIVSDIGDSWIVEARVDKVQPKATHWFQDPFYLGSYQNCEVIIDITIFCDNLNIPKSQQLTVTVKAEQRKANLEDIVKLERERFRSSPEYQRYIRTQEENGED